MSQLLFAYGISQIKCAEKLAYNDYFYPPADLMRRAGKAVLQNLLHNWPEARRIQIYCGKGNNGGDGYVAALLAWQHGLEVEIVCLDDSVTPEAINARRDCEKAHIKMRALTATNSEPAWPDVIVDALLGIGGRSALDPAMSLAVQQINQAGKPVLSIDIPTGVDADTGAVHQGLAVQASKTLTFIALKPGLLTGAASNYCGDILLDTLQLPPELFAQLTPAAEIMQWSRLRPYLQPRNKNVNKGNFGHVLVVGGNLGMAGAVRMAGEAAARVGAGLVTLATRPRHAAIIASQRPELLCYGVNNVQDLEPLLARANVLVIGPGMGQDAWAEELLPHLLMQAQMKIVDADALNFLALNPRHSQNWLLTPHPGEAARLLQTTVSSIQENRFAACELIQQRYGGGVVLKGAGSLLQFPDQLPLICRAGNPGMASAGMGDVLSGVLGGLLAQGLSLAEAGALGVLLHSMAADKAAQKNGERGMLASDLMAELRWLVNLAE